MQEEHGCFIRYDYNMANTNVSGTEKPVFFTKKVNSSFECGNYCFYNHTCSDGWSFQMSTKECNIFQSSNTKLLNPNKIMVETEKIRGWVTGSKSCHFLSAQGKFKFELHFCLLVFKNHE